MEQLISLKLDGVSETMLIPLYFRAIASKMKNPVIMDSKAIELINKINYDFSKYSDNKMTRIAITVRTIYFDREAKEFIKENPKCNCINIGCGLDTRFFRVDNGKLEWYDLDLESVIEVREKLIKSEDRVTTIKSSALEDEWTNKIAQKNLPTLIIIEGLLMYFNEEEVKILFTIISKTFPNCTILLEKITPFMVKNSSKHPVVNKTSAVFKWGVRSGKEIELLCPALEFKNEWNFSADMKKLSPVFITLIYPMFQKINNSLVKLSVKAK